MSSWLPDRVTEDEAFSSSLKHSEGVGQGPFDNYKRTGHFAEAGVEKQSGAVGLAYGSETYRQKLSQDGSWYGHTLDNRTSAERIKLKKQQKEIEEDHRAYLAQREVRRKEVAEEKRKDLEQLQQYNPWGRPAGGAPRVSRDGGLNARMQKFSAESESLPQSRSSKDYDPYGKPGAGAPLRTRSGKLATQIKGARDIRFQEHLKKEVDHLRYLPDGSSAVDSDRENEQAMKSMDRVDSEEKRKIEERNRKFKYGKKLEEQHLEAVNRREREKREQKDAPTGYIWGKNKVQRDESGKLIPRKRVINRDSFTDQSSGAEATSLAAQMGRGVCGAPVNTKIPRNTFNNTGDDYDPWGKPGAGAPLRDRNGQVIATGVFGKHTGELEKRSAHAIVSVDRKKAAQQEGIDVATWMRSRDVKKNVHKVDSSDYFTDLQAQAEYRNDLRQQRKQADKQLDALHTETAAQMWDKGFLPRDHHRNEASIKEYSDELKRAMEQKSLQNQLSRENRIAMEKKHAYTFNHHWGRPGAGAPRYDSQGHLDALPKNLASLETQVHTGRHFRD